MVNQVRSPQGEENPANRRVHQRKELAVQVGIRSENGFWAGLTENISEGGVFVATNAPFDLGTEIEVDLSFKGRDESFPIPCVVRWIRPETGGGLPPGMGLQFLHLEQDIQIRIREFISTGRQEVLFWED